MLEKSGYMSLIYWQYHLNIVTFLCYQFTYLEAPSLLWHVGPFFVPAMCNREVLHHQIPRQHCRLTIWKQFVELTNSIKSDNMIQITWLILGRGALSTNTLRTKYITFSTIISIISTIISWGIYWRGKSLRYVCVREWGGLYDNILAHSVIISPQYLHGGRGEESKMDTPNGKCGQKLLLWHNKGRRKKRIFFCS